MNQTYLRRETMPIHYNCIIYFENKSYNPDVQNSSSETTYISVYTYAIQGFFLAKPFRFFFYSEICLQEVWIRKSGDMTLM